MRQHGYDLRQQSLREHSMSLTRQMRTIGLTIAGARNWENRTMITWAPSARICPTVDAAFVVCCCDGSTRRRESLQLVIADSANLAHSARQNRSGSTSRS
jgi:hypothetical protein